MVAISWNAVLAIVLFAYFHHLYMDFAQPVAAQFLGQVASYLSAIPAAVVTIFGALLLVHRANMRWNTTTSLFVVGLAGWAIGGIGAVIDSTIAVNAKHRRGAHPLPRGRRRRRRRPARPRAPLALARGEPLGPV